MRSVTSAAVGRAASGSFVGSFTVVVWIIYVAEATTHLDSDYKSFWAIHEYDVDRKSDCLGDCKDGIGVHFSKQGIYEGQFAAGKKEGFGVHYWPDGSWHAGEYLAGRRHGQGVYRYAAAAVSESHSAL